MRKNLLHDISDITKSQKSFKPHKYLLLLSVIKLFESQSFRQKEIYYDNKLLSIFTHFFNIYASETNRNRPYEPFFHLRSHPFWRLRAVPGKEHELARTTTVGGPNMLTELVTCAVLSDEMYNALSDETDRKSIEDHVISILSSHQSEQSTSSMSGAINSAFVLYINSLHCIDANSDGALAESQARNPLFYGIHVKHPWAQKFADSLLNPAAQSHIILTGHAGDGKSTIALELYKILTHIEKQESLPSGLPTRVDVTNRITIIKDLSEWTNKEQDCLFSEMTSGVRRFVLVSNTGCLLNLFRRQATSLGKSAVQVEDELLTALDTPAGATLATQVGNFEINNLAQQDNIDAALTMLRLLVTSPLWNKCSGCVLHQQCPVFQNLRIVRQYKERVFGRMRLLLRRTVDYGNRLTMRQLSAHFAYMLTSGLDCEKIANVLQKKQTFSLEQYMFFNRFWGDNGWKKDVNATQLKSDHLIAEQGFGSVYAPSMERMLWLQSDKVTFDLGIPELEPMFKRQLAIALSPAPALHYEARNQIRRMVFFFYENASVQYQVTPFLSAFLNSPMLCEYQSWLTDAVTFSRRRNTLKDQLFHVLQEQFSGIKLPEGVSGDKTLYITLNRRQRNIRQGSQIMLGKIDFNDKLDLQILQNDDKTELMLVGKGEFTAVNMPLALPFLDYIFARKSGGIGSILQVAYVDRLENLKAELLHRCTQVTADELLLLKLDAKNVLRRQRLTITGGSLEVANG
jgi:hypothetical protein